MSKGTITQVIGAVVDVKFDGDLLTFSFQKSPGQVLICGIS